MENIQVTITNLLTGTTLGFFCPPETIGDEIQAQFDPTSIRGRSSQYHGYDTSGPRTTSLSLKIHEDYLYGTNNILDFSNRIRALAYPEYSGHVIPPRCLVRVGTTLGGICIVNNVSLSWLLPIRNNRYICADITIGLVILEPMAPSASEVEGGGVGYSGTPDMGAQPPVTEHMIEPSPYPQTEWWKNIFDEGRTLEPSVKDEITKERDRWWVGIY